MVVPPATAASKSLRGILATANSPAPGAIAQRPAPRCSHSSHPSLRFASITFAGTSRPPSHPAICKGSVPLPAAVGPGIPGAFFRLPRDASKSAISPNLVRPSRKTPNRNSHVRSRNHLFSATYVALACQSPFLFKRHQICRNRLLPKSFRRAFLDSNSCSSFLNRARIPANCRAFAVPPRFIPPARNSPRAPSRKHFSSFHSLIRTGCFPPPALVEWRKDFFEGRRQVARPRLVSVFFSSELLESPPPS